MVIQSIYYQKSLKKVYDYMNLAIQYTIGIIIITLTNFYAWCSLLKKRVNYNSLKTYLIFILMCIVTVLNYIYNNQFIRITTITIIMAIFLKILFKENLKKSILCVVTIQILYMISEIIYTFTLVYIIKITPENISKFYFGTLLTNSIVSVLVLLFTNSKIIKKFFNLLLIITNKIKYNLIMSLLLILMIAINIFFMTPYYHINFTYVMLFNIILTFICFIITIYSFYNKNKYMNVYDKYNTTLNSLREYENILDKYRILNHENKNQLITVRNMLSSNDRKVKKYIDKIIENKLKDNEKIMIETAKIPTGGLRGLIYSKILLMKKLKINYSLIIEKNVKTADIINNIDDSTMLDICKIIGVFLDNSIQEVSKLNKKLISIEMYIIEEFLEISVSNNFKGNLQIELFEIEGFTTKGENHGYGLSLTKEIISNNKKLFNEKKVNKDIFTQILKIKM